MEQTSNDFEQLASDAYAQFGSLAGRYYHTFRRPSVTRGGVPCMIFLGNHSSGKSSLINWVLGGEPVQDVGLAPTDDGFTVILYGETEEEVCGPAAVSRLPQEFRDLESFGSTFLQHLKVKVRKRDVLKTVTLIDSPGMIDSAEGTVSRTYDFEGVVKLLAELCDMVFFLLDPDKPGTTGETVNVFAKCLTGTEFKLRVLLNKCDAFSSMYDFARTYGTTCWNLARVLRTKDLPKIWTVYSGPDRASGEGGFDLADFNRHRAEFLGVLHDAAARRKDNVYSQALADFQGLSVRMCVMNYVARRLLRFRSLCAACAALVVAGSGFFTWYLLTSRFAWGNVSSVLVASLVACVGAFMSYGMIRFAAALMRQALASRIDEVFTQAYRRELAVATHDDVSQVWASIQEETAETIRSAPLDLPFFGELKRKRLDAAVSRILSSFHAPAKAV